MKTKNEDWGFYGTARRNGFGDGDSGGKVDQWYDKVGREIMSLTKASEAQVVEFLDSRQGRHLADKMVSPGGKISSLPSSFRSEFWDWFQKEKGAGKNMFGRLSDNGTLQMSDVAGDRSLASRHPQFFAKGGAAPGGAVQMADGDVQLGDGDARQLLQLLSESRGHLSSLRGVVDRFIAAAPANSKELAFDAKNAGRMLQEFGYALEELRSKVAKSTQMADRDPKRTVAEPPKFSKGQSVKYKGRRYEIDEVKPMNPTLFPPGKQYEYWLQDTELCQDESQLSR